MVIESAHMPRATLAISACLCIAAASAQNAFLPVWDHIYGGTLHEGSTMFRATSDGGFIVAAWSRSDSSGHKTQENRDSTNTTQDYWLIKLDSLGELEWERTLGGSGDDRLYDVRQTPDGGYVVAGGSRSPLSGDRTEPNYDSGQFIDNDYWMVKLAADGSIQWDKRYGGSGDDVCNVVLPLADGGFLLCGTSNTYLDGDKTVPNWLLTSRNIWLVRIDSTRAITWQRMLGSPSGNTLSDVIRTDDEGLLLLATAGGAPGGDVSEWALGDTDIWLAKLDSLGGLEWEERVGGSLLDDPERIIPAGDGGYVIASHSRSLTSLDKTQTNYDPTGLSGDYWIFKINAQGALVWDRTLGTPTHEYMFGDVIRTLDGGFLAIGGSESFTAAGDKTEASLGFHNGWMVKLDSAGSTEWDRVLLDAGLGDDRRVVQLADSSLVIASYRSGQVGGYATDTAVGETDLWVIKIALHDLSTALAHQVHTADDGSLRTTVVDGTVRWAVADGAGIVETLQLHDANGRSVRSFRPQASSGELLLQGIAPGGYVLTAFLRSGRRVSRAIVLP